MDIQEQVGETAGKVWHLINDHGSLTLAQLKKKVDGSDELVNFALGWLSREDKIHILPEKKSFQIRLK
jgi:hypothetical protein